MQVSSPTKHTKPGAQEVCWSLLPCFLCNNFHQTPQETQVCPCCWQVSERKESGASALAGPDGSPGLSIWQRTFGNDRPGPCCYSTAAFRAVDDAIAGCWGHHFGAVALGTVHQVLRPCCSAPNLVLAPCASSLTKAVSNVVAMSVPLVKATTPLQCERCCAGRTLTWACCARDACRQTRSRRSSCG